MTGNVFVNVSSRRYFSEFGYIDRISAFHLLESREHGTLSPSAAYTVIFDHYQTVMLGARSTISNILT